MLPMVPFLKYVVSKYKEENKKENYMFDCLWAMATDMRFKNKQNRPTLPRWNEWNVNKPKKEKKEYTPQDIVDMFKKMGKRKANQKRVGISR